MNTSVTIAVATTGAVPAKAGNPAVPLTCFGQIDVIRTAYEQEAFIIHVHICMDDGPSFPDLLRSTEVQEEIRRHCPEVLDQRPRPGRAGSSFALAPGHGGAIATSCGALRALRPPSGDAAGSAHHA